MYLQHPNISAVTNMLQGKQLAASCTELCTPLTPRILQYLESDQGTLPSGCVAYTVQALGRAAGYVWRLVSPKSSESL